MDILNIEFDEFKGYDLAKLNDLELLLRKEIFLNKMQNQMKKVHIKKVLKKKLAQVLTIKNNKA